MPCPHPAPCQRNAAAAALQVPYVWIPGFQQRSRAPKSPKHLLFYWQSFWIAASLLCPLLVCGGRSPESQMPVEFKYTLLHSWERKERSCSGSGQKPEFHFKHKAVPPQVLTCLGKFSTALPLRSFQAAAFFQLQMHTSSQRHPLQPPLHGNQP